MNKCFHQRLLIYLAHDLLMRFSSWEWARVSSQQQRFFVDDFVHLSQHQILFDSRDLCWLMHKNTIWLIQQPKIHTNEMKQKIIHRLREFLYSFCVRYFYLKYFFFPGYKIFSILLKCYVKINIRERIKNSNWLFMLRLWLVASVITVNFYFVFHTSSGHVHIENIIKSFNFSSIHIVLSSIIANVCTN